MNHRYRYKSVWCTFLLMKKKSAGKTTFFYCQWKSKPKSWNVFFFFLTNELKFGTFFFLIKLNILRVVLLTQHFHYKTYVASCYR